MTHIPSDILAKLKDMLLMQRAKLTSVQQDVDEANPVHDTARLDDNASPDADASEEVSMLTSEVVGQQVNDSLARVTAALKRMEEGTYGFDEKTGEPIAVERLMVDPTATHNVENA